MYMIANETVRPLPAAESSLNAVVGDVEKLQRAREAWYVAKAKSQCTKHTFGAEIGLFGWKTLVTGLWCPKRQ